MEAIHVCELRKSYGKVDAVKGIHLAISAGELFGLLGPNGAGKTTTINLLTGLARPDSGSILLLGIDGVRHIKQVQKHIGIVPDESNLYDELSGFSNLTFCASLYGMRKADRTRRAKELLETFSLSEAESRPVKTYSKGMKRKLVIAAGIIHQPSILFLDEPTTGIDVESARHIRKLILQLNRQGTTILLTTHYLEEAQRLCSRIGFMKEGTVIKTGTLDDILSGSTPGQALRLSIPEKAQEAAEVLLLQRPDISTAVIDRDTLEITCFDGPDISPWIQELRQHGISVSEAIRHQPSLEDVFVQLTSSSGKQQRETGNG